METLENSIFFRALTTTYKKRYQQVIANCYHLCIPRNGSFEPKQINDKFICAHILKPSPLLRSHFVPYNSKQNFHVQIDNGYIRVTKGFGDQNQISIRILAEEKAYNNNQAYGIFICESPLIPSLNSKLNYEATDSASNEIELVSFEDCNDFLNRVSPDELTALTKRIEQLMSTYIILPDYIEDVSLRLKRIIDLSIPLFSSQLEKIEKYRNHKELLHTMLESYSVGLVHDQLMKIIKKKLHNSDQSFAKKAKDFRNQHLKPTDFGAQKTFENFTIPKELVDLLSNMDKHLTPLAKVNCMRQALDIINSCLKKTVEEQKSPLDNHRETVYIMSDDLIAAVICVLVHCEPPYFCSTIEFIHRFSWYLPQNSELGYSLVTFEVAKEYIQNHVDQPKQTTQACKASCHSTKSTFDPQRRMEFSHLDHEIDKISQMIENTDVSLEVKDPLIKSNANELGGFLSSLADDCFTVSGQKL